MSTATPTPAVAAVTTTPAPTEKPFFDIEKPGWTEYGTVMGVVGLLLVCCLYAWFRNRQVIVMQKERGSSEVQERCCILNESVIDSLRTSVRMKTMDYGDEEQQRLLYPSEATASRAGTGWFSQKSSFYL